MLGVTATGGEMHYLPPLPLDWAVELLGKTCCCFLQTVLASDCCQCLRKHI